MRVRHIVAIATLATAVMTPIGSVAVTAATASSPGNHSEAGRKDAQAVMAPPASAEPTASPTPTPTPTPTQSSGINRWR